MTTPHALFCQTFSSPLGDLVLGDFQGHLCLCDWRFRKKRDEVDRRLTGNLGAQWVEGSTPLLETTKIQLSEYFAGNRKNFDLPLLMVGSEFQKSVWRELMALPYGKTLSYLELSRRLGNEKAIRAVAAANGANALAILVPCHRIVGSSGELTGYAGGLSVKRKLLELEGAWEDTRQVLLFD